MQAASTVETTGTSNKLNLSAFTLLKIQHGCLNKPVIDSDIRSGLAGTKEDSKVRDRFIGERKSLGCTIKVDKIGDIFVIYLGKNSGNPTAT